MNKPRRQLRLMIAGVILAFILWWIMFVHPPLNFWILMAVSTLTLTVIGLTADPGMLRSWNLRMVAWGIGSALVLWGIFWIGNELLQLINAHVVEILPERSIQLQSVYANRDAIPQPLLILLLAFPVGFGEEVFWRGLVQKQLQHRLSNGLGYAAGVALYAGVHIVTGNGLLIIAALVCGLYWGAIYWKTGSLVPVLISHMIWDPLIFVLFPLY
ncbi:MAG: type II CAAX endopeptidase family protein [candidate division KSB1 bacterium]|nr:type II CAAX endopeptidase family protein [candidate division KSB1 bacterium]